MTLSEIQSIKNNAACGRDTAPEVVELLCVELTKEHHSAIGLRKAATAALEVLRHLGARPELQKALNEELNW